MTSGRAKRRFGGFTLIEVLVVVSVIALMISMLLPALGRARDVAVTSRCASNLKQIGIAANTYIVDNNQWSMPGDFDPGSQGLAWQRYVYANYMNESSGALKCPAIPSTAAQNQGQFKPVGSANYFPYNLPPYTSQSGVSEASYIMNVIVPNGTNSYASSSRWNLATQLQSAGLDASKMRGWTGMPNTAPGGASTASKWPLRLDKVATPGGSIYIVDHRPDYFNSTATSLSFTSYAQDNVYRFPETDWATTIDPASGTPRLKVGKFVHNNAAPTWNGGLNGGSFNALYGDGHVTTVTKSDQREWVAAID